MSTVEILTQKEKELVAVAASIASGCEPCTMHHLKSVRHAGASEAEVFRAIGIALDVRDNATAMMAEASQGNLNYGYPIKAQSGIIKEPIDDLVAIGAAIACNSAASVEYYWNTAKAACASTHQIQITIGIAKSIRKEAAEKVDFSIGSLIEQIHGKAENTEEQKESVPQLCGCS